MWVRWRFAYKKTSETDCAITGMKRRKRVDGRLRRRNPKRSRISKILLLG